MRRLPLLLLALAAPALAEEPAADGGLFDTAPVGLEDGEVIADGGVGFDIDTTPPGERVGRHFAFTWDTNGPRRGEADVQLWLTPRWGRPDGYTAFDLRAGVLQGLPRDWAAGVFIDAFPSASGPTQEPAIDARLMLHVQNRGTVTEWLGYGTQAEVGAGVNGVAVWLLAAADAALGNVRIGFNVEGSTQAAWRSKPGEAFSTARLRQSFGISYTLANGISAGLELQNRLGWVKGAYTGDAFLIGPAVTYRGSRFWFSITLLPQVAAIKAESMRGVGDVLELTDNERFSLRISLGVIAR